MIVSFHQISGELGNHSKDVRQVVFQPSAERKRRKKVIGRRRQITSSTADSHETEQSVRLCSVQDESGTFIVGIFHVLSEDINLLERIRGYLVDLCREFAEKYLKKHAKLKQSILDIASENKAAQMTREDILREFKPFDAVIESMRVVHSLDDL